MNEKLVREVIVVFTVSKIPNCRELIVCHRPGVKRRKVYREPRSNIDVKDAATDWTLNKLSFGVNREEEK